jgi:hypothetical protein
MADETVHSEQAAATFRLVGRRLHELATDLGSQVGDVQLLSSFDLERGEPAKEVAASLEEALLVIRHAANWAILRGEPDR